MTENEQSKTELKPVNPFVILQKPKSEADLAIPERELKDKKLVALSDIRHNGFIVEKGSIFRMTDKDLFEHFVKFGALKEIL